MDDIVREFYALVVFIYAGRPANATEELEKKRQAGLNERIDVFIAWLQAQKK